MRKNTEVETDPPPRAPACLGKSPAGSLPTLGARFARERTTGRFMEAAMEKIKDAMDKLLASARPPEQLEREVVELVARVHGDRSAQRVAAGFVGRHPGERQLKLWEAWRS